MNPIPRYVRKSKQYQTLDRDAKLLLWFMARQEALGIRGNGSLEPPPDELWDFMCELRDWVVSDG